MKSYGKPILLSAILAAGTALSSGALAQADPQTQPAPPVSEPAKPATPTPTNTDTTPTNPDAKPMYPAAPTPGNTTADNGTPRTMSDAEVKALREFANAAAIADMYEIQAGNIAWERSKSPEVKKFGRMLIADHTGSSAKLKVLADQNEGSVTDTLDDAHQQMIDQLENADENAFDATFIKQQIDAHQKALALYEGYAKSGGPEEFQRFAKETAKTIAMHLERARGLTGSDG